MSNATKTCTLCQITKPLTEFYPQKKRNGRIGTYSRCKDCMKTDFRSRREADREKFRQSNRESYQRHKEKRLEEMREYRDANREQMRAQSREYRSRPGFKERRSAYDMKRYRDLKGSGYFDRLDVREAKRAGVRRYQATARGKAKQAHHAARSKVKELGLPLYEVSISEVIAIMAMPCAVCDSRDNIELDHIIPFARGGNHKTGNLQALCRPCNRAKRHRVMTEFRMWISRVKAVI